MAKNQVIIIGGGPVGVGLAVNLGLRGISDGKAQVSHIDDWTEYLHIIDEKLAAAVQLLEAGIEDGTLSGLR